MSALTPAPFQIGDRVRIVVDIFEEPYVLGSEFTVTNLIPGKTDVFPMWVEVDNDPCVVLVPSDLELVERAS